MTSEEGKKSQCPCCKVCKKCLGFQKVFKTQESCIVVYRHKKRIDVYDDNADNLEDAYLVQNSKNIKISPGDLTLAFEQHQLNCTKCQQVMKHAQSLLQYVPSISENDVISVCYHCRKKLQSIVPCYECEKIVKKLVAVATTGKVNEYEDIQKKHFMMFLKFQNFLKRLAVNEREFKQGKSRRYSAILTEREPIFCPEMLRPSTGARLLAPVTSTSGQTEYLPSKLKDFPKSRAQKAQRRPGESVSIKIKETEHYFNRSVSDESLLQTQKINKPTKTQSLQDIAEKSLKPCLLASHYDKEIRVQKDGVKEARVKVPTQEASFISTLVSDATKTMLPKDFRYVFPEDLKKLKDTSNIHVTSAELIKDTQDRLQMVAEETKKRQEELQFAREERKRLAEEEKRRLAEEKTKRLVEEEKKRLAEEENKRVAKEERKTLAEGIIKNFGKGELTETEYKSNKISDRSKGALFDQKSRQFVSGSTRDIKNRMPVSSMTKTTAMGIEKGKELKQKPFEEKDRERENMPKDKDEKQRESEGKLIREKDEKIGRKQTKLSAEKYEKLRDTEKYAKEKGEEQEDKGGKLVKEKDDQHRDKERTSLKEKDGKQRDKEDKLTQAKDEGKLSEDKYEKQREKEDKYIQGRYENQSGKEDKSIQANDKKQRDEANKLSKEKNEKQKDGQKDIKQKGKEEKLSGDKGATQKQKEDKMPQDKDEKRQDKGAKSPKEKDENQKIKQEQLLKDKAETIKGKEDKRATEEELLKKAKIDEGLASALLSTQAKAKENEAKMKKTQDEIARKAREAAEKAAALHGGDRMPSADNKHAGHVPKHDLPHSKVPGFTSHDDTHHTKHDKFADANRVANVKELDIQQILVRKPSHDDFVLHLIKTKQEAKKKKENEPQRITEMDLELYKRHLKTMAMGTGTGGNYFDSSDLELDIISLQRPDEEVGDIIIGEKIYRKKRVKAKMGEEGILPVLFKSEFVAEPLQDIPPTPAVVASEPNLPSLTKKSTKPTEAETRGVIRYALSDRTFIDKGWTLLPTEKVVRKMNVYRMRPAHPEFDWFEHNKNKRFIQYDSGDKLAEFDDDGRGRWYYRNGRLALDYYDSEEAHAQQRFVIYSSGEPDERGRGRPITVLATFDYMGNGVVFDHAGKIRLKYNQTEGVVLDRGLGPVSHWKWHSLNDPPVLQQVMIDTQLALKDPAILQLSENGPVDEKVRPDNEEMLAIEFDNFIQEKSRKLSQKFKPFQIKMKALKINEQFSLRVLDQATIYLLFRDGTTNLKLNLGMILDHQEIVDTDTADMGEVSNNIERLPARTDSMAGLQRSVAYAQRVERLRMERELRLRRPKPSDSVDQLTAGTSRPMRRPLIAAPSSSMATDKEGRCRYRKPSSSNVYYDTRLI